MSEQKAPITYRAFMNTVLGGFAGVLISIPMGQIFLTLLFGAAGVVVGHKRRESVGFFYFTAICVLILMLVFLYSLLHVPTQVPQ